MLLTLLQVLQRPAASHQSCKKYSMFLHDLDHPNNLDHHEGSHGMQEAGCKGT